DPIQFYAITFALLCAALAFSSRLSGSRFGMALHGVRQNEERIKAVGLRPFDLRLTAFVISGMVTGLAGALFADLNRFVSPTMFSWQTSGEILVFVILGGVGRLFGPVAGAAIYILLENWLGGVSDYWQLFLGLILLGVVLFARGGVMGTLSRPEQTDG
ncbi:MAG: branched-chain amino acid ABC transporter permease, partial [Halocynthiibacter sp.]